MSVGRSPTYCSFWYIVLLIFDLVKYKNCVQWICNACSLRRYIEEARKAGVNGALVVQPANHLYDHSYVAQALQAHPTFFRGMALANPTLSVKQAVAELERSTAFGKCLLRHPPGLVMYSARMYLPIRRS